MDESIKNLKKIERQNMKRILVTDSVAKSNKIFEKIRDLSEYVNSKSLFIYLSTEKEVLTDTIISHSLKMSKKVFVPILFEGEIFPEQIETGTIFKLGKYGIREPEVTFNKRNATTQNVFNTSYSNYDITHENSIDIAIIPMVAFDSQLNRLGHGKGYYDRWLQNRDVFKIGLAFDAKKLSQIPYEEHDVKMDMIITELKIYRL